MSIKVEFKVASDKNLGQHMEGKIKSVSVNNSSYCA